MQSYNPLSPTDLSRLRRAREESYKQLRAFREQRIELLRQRVGHRYGDNGATEKIPLPLMSLAARVYTRSLAARNPRVLATTRWPSLKPYAVQFQLAVNEVIEELNLVATLQTCISEALFGIGIAKVGLCMTADDQQGFRHDAAQPFCDAVLLENWVHDCNARSYEEVDFCGDKYRIPLREARENPLYDQQVAAKLTKRDGRSDYNTYDDRADQANSLSRAGKSMQGDDQFHDTVELWDLWLPKDKLVVTIAADQDLPPLRVVEWTGPECGPYHMLGFDPIQGNIMPLPPAYDWAELHITTNRLARKAIRQAERQKTIPIYSSSAVEDAQRVRDAEDGQFTRVDDVNEVKEIRTGGADAATMALVESLRGMFSYYAGNIDTMGGLAAQTGTVGQDQLLAQQSSGQVQEMQERAEKFTTQVVRAIGYYLWTDEETTRALTRQITGTEIEFTTFWGPDQRVGQYLDYNLQVEPYSLRPQSPSERITALNGVIGQVILPLMPIMAQQGLTVDMNALVRTLSQYMDLPELLDVIVPADPKQAEQMQMAQQQEQPPAPRSVSREPGRRSTATMQGQEKVLAQQFLKLANSNDQ